MERFPASLRFYGVGCRRFLGEGICPLHSWRSAPDRHCASLSWQWSF